MPDKRQESKQRRAAQNRANRQALAARRENAEVSAAPAEKSSGDAPEAAKSGAGRGRAGRAAAGPTAGARATSPSSSTSGKRPGEVFLWAAFALAIVGTLAMLFVLKAPVDDRGEPIPGGSNAFGGLTIAAREAVSGEPLPDESVSYLDAYGLSALISAALPLSLTAFALWASRRRADRSRMLTYAMLGMAVAIFLGGGLFVFFPALICLAIGGFIARRADLPARVAERATGTGGGLFGRRGPVIDADSEQVDSDADDLDEGTADGVDEPAATEPVAGRARRKRRRGAAATDVDDSASTALDADAGGAEPDQADAAADALTVDAAADADGGTTPEVGRADEPDPLAELEAELEAERAADEAGGEHDDDAGGGTRRKR